MVLTLLSFFFVLSLLVVVHEFGHYAVAKLGGIGVERFSIGYPPRLFGIKIGETDYCISAVLFGGYVKLHGQEDFGNPDEFTADPRDYRAKHPLLKIGVLVSGSLMNLLTAVVIFSALYVMEGVPVPTTKVGLVRPGSFAAQIGLRPGDDVLKVQKKTVENLDDILLPMVMNDSVTLVVRRADGEEVKITTPRRLDQNEEFGAGAHIAAAVGTVMEKSPAEVAGLKPGDEFLEIDGRKIDNWYIMSDIIRMNPDRDVAATVLRGGSLISLTIHVGSASEPRPGGRTETIGRIGITPRSDVRRVGVFEATAMSFKNTGYLIVHMLDFFGKLITGHMSSKLLGGPVMIAQMAGESARSGFSTLMAFTAFISINLGVLNLLPFPVLDGGHIFILFIEMITRREVSEKFKMALQQIGSLVLLILMLYITFNDIMRFDAISRLFGR
jgi:regulator of sigma E protease